ncbi:hypothetical protein L210DRAFT_3755704, partial [Boletus edulis BED1]
VLLKHTSSLPKYSRSNIPRLSGHTWTCKIPFYILLNGLSVFWDWNASKFVAAYISLPVFLVLFIGYKLRYKTKITPLAELDFVSNIPTLEETGDEELLLEKTSFTKQLRELI